MPTSCLKNCAPLSVAPAHDCRLTKPTRQCAGYLWFGKIAMERDATLSRCEFRGTGGRDHYRCGAWIADMGPPRRRARIFAESRAFARCDDGFERRRVRCLPSGSQFAPRQPPFGMMDGRSSASPRPMASQRASNCSHRFSSGSAVWLTGNSMISHGAERWFAMEYTVSAGTTGS